MTPEAEEVCREFREKMFAILDQDETLLLIIATKQRQQFSGFGCMGCLRDSAMSFVSRTLNAQHSAPIQEAVHKEVLN